MVALFFPVEFFAGSRVEKLQALLNRAPDPLRIDHQIDISVDVARIGYLARIIHEALLRTP